MSWPWSKKAKPAPNIRVVEAAGEFAVMSESGLFYSFSGGYWWDRGDSSFINCWTKEKNKAEELVAKFTVKFAPASAAVSEKEK